MSRRSGYVLLETRRCLQPMYQATADLLMARAALLVFIGTFVLAGVTRSEVRYACQYPGCECENLPQGLSNELGLTCHTNNQFQGTPLQPRNVSSSIVQLVLSCNDHSNDVDRYIEHLLAFLSHVKVLMLKGCVTSLDTLLTSDRFEMLETLVLESVTLTSGLDVLQNRSMQSLKITNSSLASVFDLCVLPHILQVNISGSNFTFRNGNLCQDSTPLGVKTLDASHSGLLTIPKWAASARNLTDLYLQDNLIQDIKADDLANSRELVVLDLSSNRIITLSEDCLSTQTDLTRLNISHNEITILPEGVFTNTSALKILDLSHNNITKLASVFESLVNLTYLDLSHNKISFISRTILTRLRSLQNLNLANNGLKNIPDLTKCPELLVVNLNQNNISYLLSGTFSGLTKLQGVGLRHNLLLRVRMEVFSVSHHMTILDLAFNRLQNLDFRSRVDVSISLKPNSSLDALGAVNWLRLDNNKLTDIYQLGKVFTGLEYLFLDNNLIRSLSLPNLPTSLKVLSVSNNRVSFIQQFMFTDFPNLITVNLRGNYPYLSHLSQFTMNVDLKIKPKPQMYIGGNLYTCDCNMAYLKTWSTSRQNIIGFSNYYPRFMDLADVFCSTKRIPDVRKFLDVPLEDFMCAYTTCICEHYCGCCAKSNCECCHPCPDRCQCYESGSMFEQQNYLVECRNSSLQAVPKGIPSIVDLLYLDGNQIGTIEKRDLANLINIGRLYLNKSEISTLEDGCFSGLKNATILYLNSNNLQTLTDETFAGLEHLRILYLQENKLEVIHNATFGRLTNLLHVDLSDNRLVFFSSAWFLPLSINTSVAMHPNPLSCACVDMTKTLHFLAVFGRTETGFEELECTGHNVSMEETNYTMHVKDFDFDEHCGDNFTIFNKTLYARDSFVADDRYLATLSVVFLLLVAVITAATIAYCKRHVIQAWLFVRFGIRLLDDNTDLDDTGRQYEAFLSYCDKDEDLAIREFVPRLEQGARQYKLCLPCRDFPVGDSIADVIIDTIEDSRRTIMLLSNDFLEDEWCRYHFQTAHHHVLKERSHRLILVLLQEVADDKLDPDLRAFLKEGKFLRFSDPWFWEKLYFAMPDVGVEKNEKKRKNPTVFRGDITHDNEDVDLKLSRPIFRNPSF